jgi:hypothetical protein
MMLGERQIEQGALFYCFSVERHVPVDHLLRSIDRFVDLAALRAHLQPYYSHPVATLPRPVRWRSINMASSDTVPRRKTATHAASRQSAVPKRLNGKSPGRSMKVPAIWRVTSPRPMRMLPLNDSERRWRCCSPTSNASSNSTACVCEDQMEPKMSSSWPPQPKTYAKWPS